MDNSTSSTDEGRLKRTPKRRRTGGARVVYPRGIEERLGVSTATRWRWERDGKLPPRDVYVGGKAIGWRPETLDAAERGRTD